MGSILGYIWICFGRIALHVHQIHDICMGLEIGVEWPSSYFAFSIERRDRVEDSIIV